MNPERVAIFIAGVQKAGTTSLYAHFAEHPQLASGVVKELHFFDDETMDWSAPAYDRLHSQYPAGGEARRRFDATPIYLFWPPSLTRIRRYEPDARFIVLVRDPIARAYSSWRMEVARGVETLPFGEAIRAGRRRLPADRTAPEWREFSYVERGFYGEQTARALSLFPREQFLFLHSSVLAADHTRILRDVSTFLGLASFPDRGATWEHRSTGVSAPVALDDWRYLRDLYREDTQRFSTLTGLDVDGWHGAPS